MSALRNLALATKRFVGLSYNSASQKGFKQARLAWNSALDNMSLPDIGATLTDGHK